MSNDELKIISEVIGIENSAAWDIVSSDPEHNLYMVHHKPEANLAEYGQIRGVVVDTLAKTVVCRSYGYAPIVETDKITIQEGDMKVHLVDELGYEHVMDPSRMHVKTGFEGTLLHVFKHDGKVYHSTRKRLDPSRSRWGHSITFMEMYWKLGGPKDDELFDPTTYYSPYCHTFIMVHPDVLVASKDNVGEGYLVYLGPKQMWSLNYKECPYKQKQEDGSLFPGVTQEEFDNDPRPNAGWIDPALHVPETVSDMSEATTYEAGRTIFSPHNLSFEEANRHLMFGFYDPFEGYTELDKRMLPGEFVVIHYTDEKGAVVGMVRVQSTAYNWRLEMRDNNPNLLHRFFQLLNGSYIQYNTEDGQRRYNSLYPVFTPYAKESVQTRIKNDGPFVVWPQDPNFQVGDYLFTREGRMYNIWLAFLNDVPLHSQYEVSHYLDYLYNNRNEVIGWLRQLESRGHLDPTVISSRAINIIETSRRFARDAVKQGRNVTADGKRLSTKQLIRRNIRNLIMKEEGSSLYRLVKEMNRWKKDMELERQGKIE
jgi:hypothetical protein